MKQGATVVPAAPSCQPGAMPTLHGPGKDDPFDPFDLNDVRARVVLPVLEGLLRPGELDRMSMGRCTGREIWLDLSAGGHNWRAPIWFGPQPDPEETLGEVAYFLADRLEDWICAEVAWGEQRIADVQIPARTQSGAPAA